MTLWEVEEAASRVCQEVDPDANIIVGATFDDGLGDRIRVSIVASGMPRAAGPEPARDLELPVWVPRSQREPAPEPFGRPLADAFGGDPGLAATSRTPPRGRAKGRRVAAASDAADGPQSNGVEPPASDGLAALAKAPPARLRKGSNGRKPGEGGQRRPPPLPEGAEPGEVRRRVRRTPVDAPPPPPVNWRELTAPPEAPPPLAAPVNWRELAVPVPQPAPPGPEFSASIVPQREHELPPRKPGFLERLGFGRTRRQA
jgi:cell division protein FtsZ